MNVFPKKSLDEWTALATRECRGKPLEDLNTQTPEGVEVKPIEIPQDVSPSALCQGRVP